MCIFDGFAAFCCKYSIIFMCFICVMSISCVYADVRIKR